MALLDQPGLHLQHLGRGLDQLGARQAAVPLGHGFGQDMRQAGPDPQQRVPGDAEGGGDPVGGQEADATHVAGEPVRVLGDQADRVAAVEPVDPDAPGGADLMPVQEDHDLAHGTLLGPALDDLAGPLRPDAGQLTQPLGLALDDLEHGVTEGGDQLAGVDRTDAADQAGGQVLLDALGGGGRGRLQEGGLELQAVAAVVDPLAGGLDPLARGDHRRPPHHGGQVAPSPHLDAQHAEAGLGIVEGHPLNRTDQHLASSRACESPPWQWSRCQSSSFSKPISF